jgi:ribosomal-protein-alanine N-acetyltransferase
LNGMSGVPLDTARLRLRARTLSDLEANLAMDLDPRVHRYIFVHGAPDEATHRAELTRRIRSACPERGGLWVVEWRHEAGFLGWCGLLPLERTGLIEIGYRYVPDVWGRGVASEAARAVLDHGFRTLGFDPIVAVAHPDNLASCRVLEKIGLGYEGLARHYDADLSFFGLTRSQYLTADPSSA